MAADKDDEEVQLRSVALQNAQSILIARQRAEEELVRAKEALEMKTRELARSLAMMRATLESTTDGIVVTGGGGQVTSFNQKYLEMWRLPRGLMDTEDHRQLLHVCAQQLDEPPQYLARIDDIYASSPSESYDLLQLTDGRVFERFSRVQVVDGVNVGRVWSFRDITASRRAEESLRERVRFTTLRAEIAAVLANGQDLQIVLQQCTDCLVRHLDVALARVWTLSDAEGVLELQGSAGMYTHRDGPHGRVKMGHLKIGRVAQECRPLLTNNVVDDLSIGDQEWARKEGLVAFAGYPLLVDGRCVGVMAIFARHPLTEGILADLAPLVDGIAQCVERKQAEAALRESEVRKAAILATALDSIITCDQEGTILEFNPAAERTFGFVRDVVIGRDMADLIIPPQLRDRHRRGMAHYVSTGDARILNRRIEMTALRSDGTEFPVELAITPIPGEGPPIFTVFIRDIADRKRAEQELRDTDRKKDEFLALLAHELRNPLAPLRNGLQVIRLAGDNLNAVAQARAMMDRQLGHMVRLIDDLLDVSRIGRHKMELRRARVALADVVDNAVETSRPVIEAAGHKLSVSLPTEHVFLDADLTRLAQVLSNLLTNSAKYTKPGGHIWLTAERRGDEIVASVRDNGIGIPADALPRVFDMFSQVDRTIERSAGGLGIGLALVKGLVEMHGGTVTAESDGAGKGSTFTVRLPALTATDGPVPAAPAGDDRPSAVPRRRILVADDNEDSARSMAGVLRLMGNEVLTAYDCSQAIDAAEEFRPELILMDVGMPQLNGYEAVRRIREQPWGRDAIIIALTGWGQKGDREQSSEAGCDGHLIKPVNFADLENLLADFAQSVPHRPRKD
jgi:PAS domain S-box-containing protein